MYRVDVHGHPSACDSAQTILGIHQASRGAKKCRQQCDCQQAVQESHTESGQAAPVAISRPAVTHVTIR